MPSLFSVYFIQNVIKIIFLSVSEWFTNHNHKKIFLLGLYHLEKIVKHLLAIVETKINNLHLLFKFKLNAVG